MEKSLCWQCANSANTKFCPWARDYTPIEGWETEPKTIGERNVQSVIVKSCPLYRKEPRRKMTNKVVAEMEGVSTSTIYLRKRIIRESKKND